MVLGMNRERRVAALELRNNPRSALVIPIVGARPDETNDDAIARYVAENGPLPDADEDQVNAIVLVPVIPKRWAA